MRKSLCFRFRFLFLFLIFLGILISHATGVDGKPVDVLRNKDTIRNGVFELGFFHDSQSNHYLGIWIHNDDDSSSLHHNSDVVWVANRNDPLTSSSDLVLRIGRDGNLILTDEAQDQLVVVNKQSPAKEDQNTLVTLLESGNLVLNDEEGVVVWQSFDYPTDAFLPGMKIGWFGLRSSRPKHRALVSWAGPDDPGQGNFTLGVAKNDSKALSAWPREGDSMDIGSWDGQSFRFVLTNSSNSYDFTFVSNDEEAYFSFRTKSGFLVSWLVMSSTGRIEERFVVDGVVVTETHLVCETPPSGVRVNATRCLNSGPWQCYKDNFSETNGTMPLSLFSTGLVEAKDEDCEVTCRNNCSCTAFVLFPYDSDAGCYVYYGNKTRLLDVLEKGEPGIVHIRGDLPRQIQGKKQRKPRLIAMYSSLLLATLALIIMILAIPSCYFARLIRRCKEKQREEMNKKGWTRLQYAASDSQSSEFASARRLGLGFENKKHQQIFFSLSAIEAATNNFATTNKLGEGGFGPVYKGQFPKGQEIAVKRLSKLSRQGVEEFKNEVALISELQHRNLVKILGCCIEANENMLIYEYMPNKSLDSFLFDSSKSALLDWNMRVNIIYGIAQGLLYLHKFSRLKIIHRDLKTSNILLDGDMNPKISDFGMARIFKEDETQASTKRVVGTYGYMSPEYAMFGHFSEKSDVFSFGIILLEIISGQKSVALYDPSHALNLPTKAFDLWNEGKGMEFVDSKLSYCANHDEDIIRCIGLGLMCVKERPGDRPDMSEIVSVLSTEIALYQRPRPEDHGAVFLERISSSSGQEQYCSTRHIEFTDISPR